MSNEVYTCTSCNTPVSDTAKFCPQCGEAFDGFEKEEAAEPNNYEVFTCTSCNSIVHKNDNFCPDCGEIFDGFEKSKPKQSIKATDIKLNPVIVAVIMVSFLLLLAIIASLSSDKPEEAITQSDTSSQQQQITNEQVQSIETQKEETSTVDIANVPIDKIMIADYKVTSKEQRLQAAKRYVDKNSFDYNDMPWHDPKWLLNGMEKRLQEGLFDDQDLKGQYEVLIEDWRYENFNKNIKKLSFGSRLEYVKNLLGDPSDSQHSEMQGLSVTDYLYYDADNKWQLVFEDGKLKSKNQY